MKFYRFQKSTFCLALYIVVTLSLLRRDESLTEYHLTFDLKEYINNIHRQSRNREGKFIFDVIKVAEKLKNFFFRISTACTVGSRKSCLTGLKLLKFFHINFHLIATLNYWPFKIDPSGSLNLLYKSSDSRILNNHMYR